ncbi:MAG: ABC transporter permease [Bacteroidetes bacterium]|nr:ABC transporter permease [Bacteroidota bacterium]
MLKNYFKTAWRNLWKHKTDSFINIIGLCVAFSSALLLLLSVSYEFSYDKFHTNAKDIYHLYFHKQRVKGEELNSSMPAPLMPTMKSQYGDVKYATRYAGGGTTIRYKDKKISQSLDFVDADFFKMFSFPVIDGNKAPLQNLDEIVLRKGTAKAVFGNEEPVGKVIEIEQNNNWKPFTVSAVVDDFPDNSSITYDAITRFENLSFYKEVSDQWNSNFHDVYVQLNSSVSPKQFETKIKPFTEKYFAEDISHFKRDGAVPMKDGSFMKIALQPLTVMHTDPEIGGGDSINRSYLYLLVAIAILIIAIACINFINLSIGKSFTRSKEIGLRKTMGALKNHVALQFWAEALLICFMAFVISCIASYLLLPEYKLLFAMHVQRNMLQSPMVWVFIVLGFLIITVIAGGYPAWLMARLNVVEVLKGKMTMSRSNRLRNGLITFQFIIAVLLISCTIISWQQIHYLRTKPVGYNTSQVISVPANSEMDPTQALQLMRNKLASVASVENVSGIYDNLGRGTDGSSRTSVLTFDYKNREIKSNWMGVSYDLVKTLDLKLVDGRDFSTAFATDSSAVLINEEMAKEIGEKNIVGMKLPVDSAKPLTVIGILKNFNFKSLRQKIDPLTLVLDKNFGINYILVKVKPNNLQASMDAVKAAWKTIAPNSEFQGSFLDENVNRQYKREEKLMQIFTTGAVIAIVLSCLGLLAMVILIISQRTKEIGIRKVLGASVGSIVALVAKDFLILVLVATVIASPIAWYAMNQWLQSFAYRISIGWYIFLAAGILSIIIALITISIQAIKAALMNPVKSLRSE